MDQPLPPGNARTCPQLRGGAAPGLPARSLPTCSPAPSPHTHSAARPLPARHTLTLPGCTMSSFAVDPVQAFHAVPQSTLAPHNVTQPGEISQLQ
jgi:hypothetical protein